MHALASVRREIGSKDRAAESKYLREFTEAFQEYESALTAEQLQAKIRAANILLVGDYHALAASQKFAAELVEQVAHERPVVLAFEAVLARDQRILDAWWRREIAEEELRHRLGFDLEWGYDWVPFFSLIATARDCADGIYGIDCVPRDDLRRIRSRDRHAAAKISEIRERHPRATLVVLFGESHMAPQHLPGALRDLMPQEKLLTVLQNVDALYWKAVAEQTSAVRLGEDAVCVFNSSPLEKYESYRLCLERWNSCVGDAPDFAPAVYNLICSLAHSLGFRLDSPRNGTHPRFLADSLPEIVSAAHISRDTAEALEEKRCWYEPETNTFLVSEFQIAEAAEESARFLHFACRGMTKSCPQAKRVEDALARFGSRLLCPELEPEQEALGDSLYRAYLTGEITLPAVRRMFLTRLGDRNQAETLLAAMTQTLIYKRSSMSL